MWKQLQDKNWANYKRKGPIGAFSHSENKGAIMVGEILNKLIPGKLCLDVGCGVLPYPSYMAHAPQVTFIGIDPYSYQQRRKYAYIQGIAEALPFGDKIFDCVLFATSLDHVQNPQRAIYETRRVLKRNGYLIIWTAIKANDEKYQAWFKKKKPALYDEFHLWAFTRETLNSLLIGFKTIKSVAVHPGVNRESIIIVQK